MGDIESILIKNNFELSKKKRYSKLLANQYLIEVEPERGGWAGAGEIAFRLKSKKFNIFMSKIFKEFNAGYYCRQTHVDLADVLMGVGINLIEDRESLTLLTANGVLKLADIISQLGSVQRTSDLYNFLYHSSTNKIMALIEGIWVQIYLMFDMGIPAEKIFEQLQHLPSDVAGPDIDIDLGALELFEQAYHTL